MNTFRFHLQQLGPEFAYGVFEGPTPERMGLELDDVFATFEAAWVRRRAAQLELAEADAEIRAAVAIARAAGAGVTQLAGVAGVSRPTIYEWLEQEAQRDAG